VLKTDASSLFEQAFWQESGLHADLVFPDDFPDGKRPRMKPVRKAVFPVAGLGTRFLPATKAMPKEMLPVVDRPLIQHVVDEAREAGIEHFIFVTGRKRASSKTISTASSSWK
jgi:hypothetical protein